MSVELLNTHCINDSVEAGFAVCFGKVFVEGVMFSIVDDLDVMFHVNDIQSSQTLEKEIKKI